jgi:hypothetical protein
MSALASERATTPERTSTSASEPPTKESEAMSEAKLKKLARKPNRRAEVPASDDPRRELFRLVREHKAIVKRAASFESSVTTKKARVADPARNIKVGDPLPNWVPDDTRTLVLDTVKQLRAQADRLQTPMLRALRKVPIYDVWLKHVYGVGPVVAAYLVAEIDIRKAVKPSQLKRFCGLAVINGRLERPARGAKNAYSKEMRTRIYQAMSAMQKNAARPTKDAPSGSTCKYLDVWQDHKHRMQSSERYDAGANTLLDFDGEQRKGAKAIINSTGWHKGAGVLLEDLYTVWRALEGLPVWPSYYAAKLGYEHGGKISVNEPRMLTLEEAIALVGYVGAVPIAGEAA